MPEWDDWSCLHAWLQDGNEFAFATLVERYRPALQRICQHLLGDPASADDATQAVFCLLNQKAASLLAPAPDKRRPLAGWLFATARLTVRNLQRQRQRRQRHERAAGTEQARLRTAASSEETVQQQALHEALAKVPHRNREALEQRYLLGRAPGEVAATLGIGEEAVKKRLQRGLGQLRRLLAGRFPELTGGGMTLLLGALPTAATPATEATAACVAAATQPTPAVLTLAKGVLGQMSIVTATKTLVLAAVLLVSTSVLSWSLLPAAEPVETIATEPAPQAEQGPRISWQLKPGSVFYTESVLASRFQADQKLPIALPILTDLMADYREVSIWRWEVVERTEQGELLIESVPLCGWLLTPSSPPVELRRFDWPDANGELRPMDFKGRLTGIGPMGGPVRWRFDPATGALAVHEAKRTVDQDYSSVLGNCGLPGLLVGLPDGSALAAGPSMAWQGFGTAVDVALQSDPADPTLLRSPVEGTRVELQAYRMPRFTFDTGAGIVGIDLQVDATGTTDWELQWHAERQLPVVCQSIWRLDLTLTGTASNQLNAQLQGQVELTRRSRLLDLEGIGSAWPTDAPDLLRRYGSDRLRHWQEQFHKAAEGGLDRDIAFSVLLAIANPIEGDSLWERYRLAGARDF